MPLPPFPNLKLRVISFAKADLLVTGARSLFLGVGDHATGARLKNIQIRLADEIRAVEQRIP